MVSNLYRRLRRRGHTASNLDPLFYEAAVLIETREAKNENNYFSPPTTPTPSPVQTDTSDLKTLYLHWRYHPYGISRKELRVLYNKYLQGHTDYDHMVVAQSRPPNIKDQLVSINFNGNPGNKASETNLWKNPSHSTVVK